MARNFDIGTLRSFITVVELAGVTRAANKLHLTQSTVSMQLKRLEELVGLSLLTRNYSGMCTTPDGEHFLSYARRLVELNDEALGRLPQRAEGGVVRFGVSPDIVEPHVRRILKQFVQAYPRVSVRLFCKHSVKLLERFNAGKLDVIITTEKSSSTACTVLLERDLVWTGAIDGKAWRLDPLPLTFTRICMFRKTSIAALDSAGMAWEDAIDSGNNLESGAIACSADLGVRAGIQGFHVPGIEQVNDVDNRLPKLPRYFINLYQANTGTSNDVAIDAFTQLVKNAFVFEFEFEDDSKAD